MSLNQLTGHSSSTSLGLREDTSDLAIDQHLKEFLQEKGTLLTMKKLELTQMLTMDFQVLTR